MEKGPNINIFVDTIIGALSTNRSLLDSIESSEFDDKTKVLMLLLKCRDDEKLDDMKTAVADALRHITSVKFGVTAKVVKSGSSPSIILKVKQTT